MEEKTKAKWNIGACDPLARDRLAEACEISPFLAKILCCRGITEPDEALALLRPDSVPPEDPFLMADMEKGARRLNQAIEEKKKITVFGDYDADGVSATVLMLSYLKSREAEADYFIPDRQSHGYGLKKELLAMLAQRGTELVVTVDCGVSSREEALYAKELGLELVITDHHACLDQLPEAEAVINPNRPDCPYPFKGLAGCGVALKLICAAHSLYCGHDAQEELLAEYADIVALGTVADVMPLRGENRVIVGRGLRKMNDNPHPGFSALLQAIGEESERPVKNVTCSTVGYQLAPRVNAAGRMESADVAVCVFLAPDEEARLAAAGRLCELNHARKQEEDGIFQEAVRQLKENIPSGGHRFLIAADERWHPGIIGIAAARITERSHLPCLLLSLPQGEDSVGRGSGRSIRGFHIAEALSQCSDLLEAFGGHEMAAGVSVKREKLPLLKERLDRLAREKITPEMRQKQIHCDCELRGEELTAENVRALSLLEPTGTGNPPPRFCVRGALIRGVYPLSGGKHTKLLVEKDGVTLAALCFKMAAAAFPFGVGSRVDLDCTMDVNVYRNIESVQLIVNTLRTAENREEE